MPKAWLLLALLLLLSLPARAEEWPALQWSQGTPASGPALQALEEYAFVPRDDESRQGIRTDALLVIRDGRLLYERYAGATGPQTPHLAWSASKSLLAVLLGVAFGEGRFQLQDPAAKFYPPLEAHPDITLADLLHWASGLDWQEDYEYAPLNSSVVAMLYTRGHRDMAAFTAQQTASGPPGQVFRYSSGDSNLLAASLRGMVGEGQYADYPWRALFEPLGITQAVWERDAAGTFVASSYLYLTARDLARIGLLMQRDGRWRDRQLLPKAWVEFCRTPFRGYRANQDVAVAGGHWWLNREVDGAPLPWPDAPADTYAALGHWGQALYVLPAQRLVIVRYGDDRDGSYQHNELLKRVLAAFATPEQP
ncbi:serine hydrolase domain-containing protein [Pseudomonas protegens]|jgi:CubicO group peptidase (beta-lactamase class C family)|uniref:serine hydrolase domain-containing protein n=1 Tax=Pseudomonas protegens TaxID=380021 RepID=UPI00069F5EBB|nr:serine hydrolase [Pseudomonas protegens]MDK1394073.1 serine hydrolase [Pseudomonas protegens]MDS9878130.1 serine hydrolase [Pseudomonas protegens]NAN54552.1 class C beta-lactamase-related serine hydrolase [Pseudomonas protegens]NMZ28896.1 serine hydrolase [Pseudomonas protegens]NMZ88736.1 serine hydrolase [Pseudomonas protegens]